jgi:ABC-2 type transport system ATP-binding protein
LSDLRTVALSKSYGPTVALDGVELRVPEGSVYGLVGPNGSGKTTALEILVGLRRPSSGWVELGVEPDRVAYCPDTPTFEPWLSAFETLEAAAGLVGRPRPATAIAATLSRVGLDAVAHRRVGGFSRGMRSRLGIAAALVNEPRLLIADEPAAALDPAGRWEVIDLLAALSGQVTILVSSHDLHDVERVCSHVGVLSHGRLAFQGDIERLLSLAGSALRVVVRPPADRLVTALDAAPWVRAVVEREPGELIVDLGEPRTAETMLPRLLAECDARLVEVARTGAGLEGVFFELTATGPHAPKSEPVP